MMSPVADARVNNLSQMALSGSNVGSDLQIDQACARACAMIAPAWPLDRAIAVNPHWERVSMPLRQVAARLAVLGGIQVFPERKNQLRAWRERRIHSDDLQFALKNSPAAEQADLSPEQCIAALKERPDVQQLPLLIDVLDNDSQLHSRLSWRQAITHQVSQTCAAYFDQYQADWHPDKHEGLYSFWRDTLQHDHGIGALMGLPRLGGALSALPPTRRDAERWVLERLGLNQEVWADYLESVLLTVNGWASWCAYLGWQAKLEGREDEHLRDLLAIRLAWGLILLECTDDANASEAFAEVQRAWNRTSELIRDAEKALLIDEIWQAALEAGYQRDLIGRLSYPAINPDEASKVEVQAAFCIDVRSEPIRRALEAVWPATQTIGFAGFFGLPVAYTPLATNARRPQLPGLLAPSVEVTDQLICQPDQADVISLDQLREARREQFVQAERIQATSRWPGTAFSFVEAAGIGYLAKLWRWLRPSQGQRENDDQQGIPARYRALCRPQLSGLTLESKVDLAAGVLHGMGLDQQLAPLVVLAGHGSQSSNNAHAAALDCGACCGQTGEVNARSLALLLNESEVREGLLSRGISIPADSWFVAALHNTTTDELEGFDIDLLPASAAKNWERFEKVWAQASDQVRRERAPALGMNPVLASDDLLTKMRRRANDGAQTRPEWGLAGNAAFIIAPRERSRGVVLQGRTFLHDYDYTQDSDNSLLELLMTAPMLVTHWINWQYHASTCDPTHLGSGNKVLHNVVGGHIGVFEGNGGDLRIGLSQQSLHDGQRWVHEPLRLTVVIDAPRSSIESITLKHPIVQQLIDNGWLHLWRFEQNGFERYMHGEWNRVEI